MQKETHLPNCLWTGYVSSHEGIMLYYRTKYLFGRILQGTVRRGFRTIQLRHFRHKPKDSQGHPHWQIALQIFMEPMHPTNLVSQI